MSKPTHNHKLILSEDGSFIESIAVTSDPLTSITYMEVDQDGNPTNLTVQAHNEPFAKFGNLARDIAVIKLRDEGEIVVGGISKSKAVRAMHARTIGKEAEASVLSWSAEVPTPMSTDQVNKEIRTAHVDEMREEGATDEEVIAYLLG